MHPLAASFVDVADAYIASISWIAALPEEKRAETLTRIGGLIAGGETPVELPIHAIVSLTNLS